MIVYIGFGLGGINTLLFARFLTLDENGLTGMFVSIGSIMFAFANVGTPSFINKFYPYYRDNLPDKKNDMMTLSLLGTGIAFLLVIVGGIVFKPLVIQKFGNNSAGVVKYYYWIFPFGLGQSLFTVLEAYGWQRNRAVLTSFLRECQWRLLNLLLILGLALGILRGFDLFVKLYSFTYLLIALIMTVALMARKQLHFTFSISRVTRKFASRIKSMILLAWTGSVMFNLSFYFAQIVIASVVPGGLDAVAVFTFGQFVASLIMAPQRGVAAAAIGPLSQAWKDKDYGRIGRIYTRSSINQLVFSIVIFILVALNFRDAILFFGIPHKYLAGESVFLIIGLNRVIDMGTGLNTQIIGTSTYWRFDFVTGMILVAFTIPLNYWLAKHYGIMGPAIADILTFSLYNAIRCIFLYRKFHMQPFNSRTIYTLLLGAGTYALAYFCFRSQTGFLWMIIRSVSILALYGGGAVLLRLSEDSDALWLAIRKKLRL